MTLRLNGSASGYTELEAAPVAGNNKLTLPASSGSSGQILKNSNGVLDWSQIRENADGSVSLVAGSAAAPSVSFTGDIDTGIYSPGANQVAISTGGTGRVFVDASGRVGIGTAASVGNGIHTTINTNSYGTALVLQNANVNGWAAEMQFLGTATTDIQAKIGALATGPGLNSGALAFYTANAGSYFERLRITSDGKVGIGTASPSQLLTTVGNIKIAGAQASNNAKLCLTRTDTSWSINNETDLRFYRGNGDTDSPGSMTVVFTNGGNVGVGTTAPSAKLTINETTGTGPIYLCDLTAPSASQNPLVRIISRNAANTSTTSVDLYKVYQSGFQIINNDTDASNFTSFNVGSSERARIDSSGRLLVGTSTTNTNANTKIVSQLNAAPRSSGGPEAALLLATASSGYALAMGAYDSGSVSSSYTWISSVRSQDSFYDSATIAPLSFRIADREALRIDSQLRLLVGTSSTSGNIANNDRLAVVITGEDTRGGISVTDYAGVSSTIGSYAALRLQRSYGATDGSFTALPAGSWGLGRIEFNGSNGVGFGTGATIESFCDNLTWSSGDHPGRLVFSTTADGASSPTERMRIDSSGRVGIGTTTPSNTLEVVGGATTNLFAVKASSSGDCLSITARAAGNGAIVSALNSAQSDYEPLEVNGEFIYFQTRTGTGTVSERARIDSSGRLLVGTSSYSGNGKLVTAGNTGGNAGTFDICWAGSRPTTADTDIGYIRWFSADNSSSNAHYASIHASSDGNSSSGSDIPGRLVFSTTADGASSPTERMRISQSGLVTINGPGGGTFLKLANSGGYDGLHEVDNTAYTIGQNSNVRVLRMGSGNNYLTTGVSLAAGGTSWGTYSDERLKTDIAELNNCLENIKDIRCVSYRLANVDEPESKKRLGVIAQDLVGKYDEAVNELRRSDDDETEYLSVQYTDLVPVLIKALQEAQIRIETLEAENASILSRISALEGA